MIPLNRRQTCDLASLALLACVLGIAACEKPYVETLQLSAEQGSAQPHLASSAYGEVVLSWLTTREHETTLYFSTLEADGWSDPAKVASGSDWFVNWADFPSVQPITENLWAAHWLVKNAEPIFAYDVAVSLSHDGGLNWGPPITPHNDGTPTEHGFATLFALEDQPALIWLDGRQMAAGHGKASAGPMTLRGALLHTDQQAAATQILDDRVCDCCQTDVAVSASGPIAVYRNRSEHEIRDIYVSRMEQGVWRAGRAVATDNWKILGCPVNGPAIDAQGERVAVAWFTAGTGGSRVRVAWSDDAGLTFSDPFDIDTEPAIGRVDVALLSETEAVVSWMRRGANSQGEIVVRRVSSAGILGDVQVVAETTGGRPSGFPQMILSDGYLIFAWTNTSAEVVQTARLSIHRWLDG